jgi:hypothetical protein
MAKKKEVQRFVMLEPPPDADPSDENPPDNDELRAIAEMEGGSDIKWTVTRTSDFGNKRAGYVGTLTTGDVSMETIANEWGKGTYRVRGTRSNGQFVKQTTVIIAEEPKRQTSQTLMPAGGNSTQDLLAILDAREAKSSETMLKWAAILAPLLAPALQNLFAGQKGTTLSELTTALANIKALDGGGKVDQMTEFTKLLELVDRVKGDPAGATGSNWVDVIRDGIKELGPMAGAILAARGGLPAPPKVTQVPTEGAALAAPEDPMIQLLAWLKSQLEALTYQASMNKDPSLYAEVMLDNMPPSADPKFLRDYLAKDDWWTALANFHAPVQPYKSWFEEARVELLKGLDEMIVKSTPPPAPAPKPAKAPKTPKPAP